MHPKYKHKYSDYTTAAAQFSSVHQASETAFSTKKLNIYVRK